MLIIIIPVRRKMFSSILLVGGGAKLAGLPAYLQSKLNSQVQAGQQLGTGWSTVRYRLVNSQVQSGQQSGTGWSTVRYRLVNSRVQAGQLSGVRFTGWSTVRYRLVNSQVLYMLVNSRWMGAFLKTSVVFIHSTTLWSGLCAQNTDFTFPSKLG